MSQARGFTLFALLFVASTALFSQTPPFLCTVTSPTVTPTLRSEGLTELTGDITLSCTGGTAVTSGAIPQFGFALGLNTQVTSQSFPVNGSSVSEALLLVDEPGSNILCPTPASGCSTTVGAATVPNTFSGVVSGNQVTWNGIPLNGGTHTIRLTNVRANATQVAPTGTGTLVPTLAITPPTGSPIAVTLPTFPVKQGLIGTITMNGGTTSLFPFVTSGTTLNGTINMQEGFTNAWDQHLGHPISVVPGSGNDGGTRLGATFFGPPGMQVVFPVTVQSPWVFITLSSTNTGGFSPITANTTLNGVPAFATTCNTFNTTPDQGGTCTLNWYGSGPSNFDQVLSGQVRSFSTPFSATTAFVTSGVVPGFQGYMIAVCNFQYAHGFAFISDLGARNLASGYLSLVLAQPISGASDATAHGASPQISRGQAAAAAIPVLTTVNSASYNGHVSVAANSLASGFSSTVGTSDAGATVVPLPTTLGGISARLTDSSGNHTALGLVHVNSQQVNYLLPATLSSGIYVVEIVNGGLTVSAGALSVIPVAPGFFSANANGTGVAAGTALLVSSNNAQQSVNLAQLSGTQFIAAPIDLTPAGQSAYLVLYGTGFRGVSGLSGASCQVGGQKIAVQFAGAQGSFSGLDQLNLGPLPTTLAGKGEVPVQCVFDGAPANAVTVSFK